MVYVVERYLPGVPRDELERKLERLRQLTWGTHVEYLGSTIVPDDEACFCQFEALSEDAVAEANRLAGLPFDRIVSAVAFAGVIERERRA